MSGCFSATLDAVTSSLDATFYPSSSGFGSSFIAARINSTIVCDLR
jgi:hypothetical protein